MENKFPKYKDHLNKTFLEELNYKFWSTKGIRFKASKRLLTMDNLSNKSLAFLSSYLIILSLIFVYNIISTEIISTNFIAFGSTALSIMILVFTQIEYAQDYKTRASKFQECALKISNLYNELRIHKTLKELNENEVLVLCKSLSDQYQDILYNYPNHDDVDYRLFKVEHKEYYELNKSKIITLKIRYYFSVKLLYHSLIFVPPVIFVIAFILFGK
jgi:hypothetical protein